jgi:hypothetical protein
MTAAAGSQRLELAAGVVEVAEVMSEMHGHLYVGPPKATAGRRRVDLPRGQAQLPVLLGAPPPPPPPGIASHVGSVTELGQDGDG